jgi:hypothetical protein
VQNIQQFRAEYRGVVAEERAGSDSILIYLDPEVKQI